MLVVLCAPVAHGATSVSRTPCLVPVVACIAPAPRLLRKPRGNGAKFLLTFRSFLLHWGCVVLLPFDSCPPGVAALNRRASFLYTTGAVAPNGAYVRWTTVAPGGAYVRCTRYDVRLKSSRALRGAAEQKRTECDKATYGRD